MKKTNKGVLFKFQPFSRKQKMVLNWWQDGSPYKDFDGIIADGSIRSGKTISMICSFLIFSQQRFYGQNFIIAGRTIGALKRNVIQPMLQILNTWGWTYSYNRSENYLIIGTNTYYMFGANTEASQDSLQGLTSAGALADEVALFPKSFTDQMVGRCSVQGSKLFFNCNPKGPYHYFKTEFVDKCESKKIFYLHFTMDDNLSLSQEVKERFKRMFTGLFFKRYILGLWVMAEGIIYDMFDENIHVVNVLEDFNLGKLNFGQYFISCDYGTQNPMVFLLFGKSNEQWYLIKEYYYDGRNSGKQKTDEEYYNDLENFIGDTKVQSIIVDPSASSFITCIRSKEKYHVKKAKNDVDKGIRNTATAISLRKILIDKSCRNTIQEFNSYVWNEKSLERGLDEPLKVNDHCMDALRYFVNTVLSNSNTTSVFK